MRYVGIPRTIHMKQIPCREEQRVNHSLTIDCTDGHRREFSLSEESARLVMLGNVVPALVEIEADEGQVRLMVVHRQLGGST